MRKSRGVKKERKSRVLYAAGAFGLLVVLLCAFFVPQILFRIRDGYLCRDVTYEEREKTDLSLLSSDYETSLFRRLQNFSDGLYRGRDYYVSVEELPVTEETYREIDWRKLADYNQGNYILPMLWEAGLLSRQDFSENIYEDVIFIEPRNSTTAIHTWKQYVIYSDNYSEGVNFLIWYFELTIDDNRMKLLVDAEDMTVYGVWAERTEPASNAAEKDYIMYNRSSLQALLDSSGIDLTELCFLIYYTYDCVDMADMDDWYDGVAEKDPADKSDKSDNSAAGGVQNSSAEEDGRDSGRLTRDEVMQMYKDGRATDISWDGNTFFIHLFPSVRSLDFSIQMTPAEADESEEVFWFPEIYCGIDDICRLIPEFADQ